MKEQQRSVRLGALAVESILFEVSATPKPGLVDRFSNGAHHDMDFFTFMSSAAALRLYFDSCASVGMDHSAEPVGALLGLLQREGIAAERQMFAMTKGVNTHKGMIFSLGILVGAAGWALSRGENLEARHLCHLAGTMCHGLCREAYGHLEEKSETYRTRGENMYLTYGVTGVRGEAENGYPSVLGLSLPVYRKHREAGCSVNDALVDALLVLIAGTDDTNILGRHDMETLCYAQARAQSALAYGGITAPGGKDMLKKMDEDFTNRWISPGGSADLVALTHFLYELETCCIGL